MKIFIEMETDNAAFEPDTAEEVIRILKEEVTPYKLRRLIELGQNFSVRDYNGNVVGNIWREHGKAE